uniref:Uncharacterized protein n=1 Tax=Malurus cyaneus samueli TaxID=2593467 RepID=A0A8C5U382_9PASS
MSISSSNSVWCCPMGTTGMGVGSGYNTGMGVGSGCKMGMAVGSGYNTGMGVGSGCKMGMAVGSGYNTGMGVASGQSHCCPSPVHSSVHQLPRCIWGTKHPAGTPSMAQLSSGGAWSAWMELAQARAAPSQPRSIQVWGV